MPLSLKLKLYLCRCPRPRSFSFFLHVITIFAISWKYWINYRTTKIITFLHSNLYSIFIYRIASFHYSQLRNNCSDSTSLPKTTLQLCKYHYEKSANILDSLKEAGDYLIVQLERISLQEFLAESKYFIKKEAKHISNS